MSEVEYEMKNETEDPARSGNFRRAIPTILAALGVFFALCFFMQNTGFVGAFMSKTLLGLFSFAAYLLPVLFFLHAVFFKSDIEKHRLSSRIVFSFVSMFSFSLLISSFCHYGEEYAFDLTTFFQNGRDRAGGGVIGDTLHFLFEKAFGSVGVIIILLALLALYYTFFFAKERDFLHVLVAKTVEFFSFIETKCKQILAKLTKKNKPARVKLSRSEEKREEKYEELKRDSCLSAPGVSEIRIRELGIHEVYSGESRLSPIGAEEQEDTVEEEPVTISADVRDMSERALPNDRAEDVFGENFDPFRDSIRRVEKATEAKDEPVGFGTYAEALDAEEAAYAEHLRKTEFERKKQAALDRMNEMKEREEAEKKSVSFTVSRPENEAEKQTEDPEYITHAYRKPVEEEKPAAPQNPEPEEPTDPHAKEAIERMNRLSDLSVLEGDGVFAPFDVPTAPPLKRDPPAADRDGLYTEHTLLTSDLPFAEEKREDAPSPRTETPVSAYEEAPAPAYEETAASHKTVKSEPEMASPASDFDRAYAREEAEFARQIPDDEPEDYDDPGQDEDLPEEEGPVYDENDYSDYEYPPVSFLHEPENRYDSAAQEAIRHNADVIINTLADFNVSATLKGMSNGPRITRYEIVPATGVRVSKVTSLFQDIELALASEGVRMEAPIPGKSAIGFEVPNRIPKMVYLRELVESPDFMNAKSKTLSCVGKDVSNNGVFCDIADMPHLLVAGATGMGKSVCINAILLSILYRARPDEVKFIIFDPKRVEFKSFNGIPHLLVPVVTEANQAAGALSWAVDEMERRYALIEGANCKKIDEYNAIVKQNPDAGKPMPKIIIVIDELADLMLQAKKTVESLIVRLTQKARAAGIHLILGTQRPSVDVVTGLIKSNVPSRITCKVASPQDSVVILSEGGAEKLLNRGDMLYMASGATRKMRVQSAFVSNEEAEKILDFLRSQSKGNNYNRDVMAQIDRAAQKCSPGKESAARDADDDCESGDEGGGDFTSKNSVGALMHDQMFLQIVTKTLEGERVSVSYLQRVFSLGFQRCSRYMDAMYELGIVGESTGNSKPRPVLMTQDEWIEKRRALTQRGE